MLLKRMLILLFMSFYYQIAFADPFNIDSLLSVSKSTKIDTTRINTLNLLAYTYVNTDPDTALYYAIKAKMLATNINYQFGLSMADLHVGTVLIRLSKYDSALQTLQHSLKNFQKLAKDTPFEDRKTILDYVFMVYTNIGEVYYLTGDFSEALKKFSKSLNIAKEIQNETKLAIAYNNIAIIYTEQGNYPEALKNQLAALKIVEKTSNKVNISSSYNNIGGIYDAMRNYPEALKNHKIALKLREEANDKEGIADSYSNIATAYANLNLLDDALKNNYASLKIWNESNNKTGLALAYLNIGMVQKQQHNYSEALKNYFISLSYSQEMEGSKDIASVYSEIGTIYFYQKKYKEALSYLYKALTLSKELGSLEQIYTVYAGLASLDSAMGNYKEALMHYQLAASYHDSLYNNENTRKLVQAQMQYDFDKKETEAKELQNRKDAEAKIEANRQRIIRNSTSAGLAILLLFSTVVSFQRTKISREKKRSDLLLADKEILLKEIHHRVKNNLEVISSLLELQAETMNDNKAKAAVLEGQSRVQSIALIHHKLYRDDDVALVEFKSFVNDLFKQVEGVFKKTGMPISFLLEAEETKISIDAAVPLGLILNELLTNSFKYAIKDDKLNTIHIILNKQPINDSFLLIFKDNGPGMPANFQIAQSTSLGMKVIQLLTKQLGGKLNFYNDEGSVFEIPFKTSTTNA